MEMIKREGSDGAGGLSGTLDQFLETNKITESKLLELVVTRILKNRDHSNFERLSIFPLKEPVYYELFQRSEVQRWPEDEVSVVEDVPDFLSLSEHARSIILDIIAFFLVGDGAVNEALIRFLCDYLVSISLGRPMSMERLNSIISQMSMETIHQGSYTIAGLTYVGSMGMLNNLIARVADHPAMRAKVEFSERWTESGAPFWQRCVANSAMEGIGFVSAFATIFYFRSINRIKRFVSLNELIAKDEFLHREMWAIQAKDEISAHFGVPVGDIPEAAEDIIRKIVREAVDVEDAFIDHLLSDPLDDLNKEDLKTYIRCVANTLLGLYDLAAEWDVTIPFGWMADINMEQKTNMFEGKVVAYANANLSRRLDILKRAGIGLTTPPTSHLVRPEDTEF
jgi:ribonucleoside-diphosphate reductase subunit M2